jgi:hypothetical protein
MGAVSGGGVPGSDAMESAAGIGAVPGGGAVGSAAGIVSAVVSAGGAGGGYDCGGGGGSGAVLGGSGAAEQEPNHGDVQHGAYPHDTAQHGATRPPRCRLIHECFRAADTPNEEDAFAFALPIVGLDSWPAATADGPP